MYNYIHGTVTIIQSQYIVVENNGIGYAVKVGNPFSYQLGVAVQIFTYYHVREDVQELYGFSGVEERDFFLKLLSVKGIGPKSAMAIVAAGAVDKVIYAIEHGDSQFLRKFPGIGIKASQQIILDLHGKLDMKAIGPQVHPKVKELREALKALGYSGAEIKAMQPEIDANLDKPLGELVKIVLKKMV